MLGILRLLLLLCWMAGCTPGLLTRADFAHDLRQVVAVSTACIEGYQNRQLLDKANKLTVEIRDKYRGGEVATKEFKPDFETLGLLSASLMAAKSPPEPSLLKMSSLLGESPPRTPPGRHYL